MALRATCTVECSQVQHKVVLAALLPAGLAATLQPCGQCLSGCKTAAKPAGNNFVMSHLLQAYCADAQLYAHCQQLVLYTHLLYVT
jgi:hypothetical protein